MVPASSEGSRGGTAATLPVPFVGRYQILERIGEGGMGALFLARDPVIERLVAIKVLRQGHDQSLRERFLREGRAAGRLRHRHIVTIFDVGEHDGSPFIAMEFLAGETLAALIRQGARLALSRRLKLLEELCDGLAYAHRAGLVHRDIKPANLMVDADGTLKILDFGIVRVGDSGMTEAGALVGTINYMSPEQVAGEPVDHRSDIFAVGLVAYEFISLRQAFPGALNEGLFQRINTVTMEPIGQVCPTLDASVIAIVNQALRRIPAERYQDLARMRNDLAATRQRLELEEERAATAATAQAGETAVVSTPVPSSVSADGTVQVVRPATPIPSAALVDAERAMAMGNYRAALTLAGRSAAEGVARNDASSIVQRAHAALLEQGRRLEQHTPTIKLPTPTPTTQTAISGPMGNWIAIGVAVVALVAAGAAMLLRPDPATPAPTSAPQQSAAPLPSPPGNAANTPAEPSGAPVVTPREEKPAPVPAPTPAAPGRREPPRGSSPPAGPPPRVPVMPARVGVNGVTAPVRTRAAAPVYPPAALAAGVQGTVELEITISTEGDVADARVTRSIAMLDQAAVQAVEQWKYAPTLVAGSPVAVIHSVQVAFTLPAAEPAPREREATPPVAPPTPPPAEPPPPRVPAPGPPTPPEPGQPAAPDPRAEEAAIRAQLRSYEAAWKGLDLAALQQLQRFSSQEVAAVQRTIAGAESYDVVVTVDRVRVNGTRAEVSAQVARRFQPKSGRATSTNTPSTFELEKQGERWMIVRIR